MALTAAARTVLRSRIRRHADAILIGQHINGEYGASNVASLTTDQLLATAAKFNVPLPDADELQEYNRAGGGASGLIAADSLAANKNPQGPMAKIALANSSRPAIVQAVVGSDADDQDNDADDSAAPAPVQVEAPKAEATKAEAPKTDDTQAAEIEQDVREVMALMGAGNFEGYQNRLRDMAKAARKPAEVRVIHAVDTSKIVGQVPEQTGIRTMAEVGITVPSVVNMANTALPIYDTQDAPAIDPHYVWHPMTGLVLAAARRNEPMFLYGPAGTGKTEFAKQVAARWGRRFVRISCDDQTEAQTLVGMTVPDTNGGVKWQDGQLAAAIRIPGAVILVDEPSVARPGALFVLQAVMDGDKRIHVSETGEVIRMAPDVIVLLADNTNGTGDTTGQYEATRRLNRATLDRPAGFIRFDYMDPTTEAALLVAKSGCSKKQASALAKFGALTRSKADEGKLAHPVGLRRLLAFGAYLADGADPVLAFQAAVIEGAPYDDKEPLRQFFTAEVKPEALN